MGKFDEIDPYTSSKQINPYESSNKDLYYPGIVDELNFYFKIILRK